MCATGKSFRSNRDKEIINFSKEAYVGANISLGDYEKFIEIKLDRDRPKESELIKQNLKVTKKLNSGLNVVIFSPEDLRIIKDGPQERRNFLDNGVSQIKPVYNYNMSRYKRFYFNEIIY